MSANQLIAKALSTESEDEAVACLKMARKKGLKIDGSTITSEVEQEWAKLVVQARSERDNYKRLWADQGYQNKKLQVAIDNAAYVQILAFVGTAILSSMFWLLILL